MNSSHGWPEETCTSQNDRVSLDRRHRSWANELAATSGTVSKSGYVLTWVLLLEDSSVASPLKDQVNMNAGVDPRRHRSPGRGDRRRGQRYHLKIANTSISMHILALRKLLVVKAGFNGYCDRPVGPKSRWRALAVGLRSRSTFRLVTWQLELLWHSNTLNDRTTPYQPGETHVDVYVGDIGRSHDFVAPMG